MELDQRRNRGLSMKEYHLIPMPHVVKVPFGSRADHQERRHWCEFNLQELWFAYELSEGTGPTGSNDVRSFGMYQFTSAQDAMVFKLTWGGRKPRPRRLP